MRVATISVLLLGSLVGACSMGGQKQAELFVNTMPPGASCTVLHLRQPVAEVADTPGIALLDPSIDEVTVECRRHAFADAATTVAASPSTNFLGQQRYAFDREVMLVMTPAP